MKEPEWIAHEVILAIHEVQLAEHGGMLGIRETGLLESALASPKNVFAYANDATLNQLAAAYAVGIAKNHAFVDGNKRTGWIACALFLELNGVRVTTSQTEVVRMMLSVAAGEATEEAFTAWLDKQYHQ